MFLRALIAFLVLPGMAAGLIPVLLMDGRVSGPNGWRFGWGLVGAGLALLLCCVRDFFVTGRGTLAPWNPPQQLVLVGLCRFVRNPMYLAVLTILAGWGVVTGARVLAGYGVLVAAGFHLRVIYHEEPWLRRQFSTGWAACSAAVPRWLPRVRPWRGKPPRPASWN